MFADQLEMIQEFTDCAIVQVGQVHLFVGLGMEDSPTIASIAIKAGEKDVKFETTVHKAKILIQAALKARISDDDYVYATHDLPELDEDLNIF